MNFIRCYLQRTALAAPILGPATPRRLFASARRRTPHAQQSILDRVYILIGSGHAFFVPPFFVRRLARGSLGQPEAEKTSEMVLNLLLRQKAFDEAFQIDIIMRNKGLRMSDTTRAKVLTAQLVRGMIGRRTFLHNIADLFRKAKFKEENADLHVHDILRHLTLVDKNATQMVDAVANLYIKERGKGYRLDSRVVAYLVGYHVETGKVPHAEKWLDYHADRPTPESRLEDPEFCVPYAMFARALIAAEPEKDPKFIYAPVLDRMARELAVPDAVFMNVLITAELERDHVDRALAFYDALRSHVSLNVYPNEVTYSQLFAAAGRRASGQNYNEKLGSQFSIPPRMLFREMCELHALLARGEISGRTSVLTKASLNAALLQFVVNGDYAGAIVALKMYKAARVEMQRRAIQSVIIAIVRRCRREIKSDDPMWAKIFLDLRGSSINRAKRMSNWTLTRRVMIVAKRTLAIAHRELCQLLLDKLKKAKQTEQTEGGEEGKGEDISGSPLGDSNEAGEIDAPKDISGMSMRAEKHERMRDRRFGLIDILLSRVLETDLVLEGDGDSGEQAYKAVEQAHKDMIPNQEDTLSGSTDEARENTIPVDPSNSS